MKTSTLPPGKGWFISCCLDGPEGPAFDGCWKPGT